MPPAHKVEFSQRPEAVFREILLETGDIDQGVARFVKELRGRRATLLPALVEQWALFVCDGGVKMPPPKAPTKLKSKRLESLARKAAVIQRQIAREAEAVALVEQRFIARIAKDTTMHELWKLTTAKLGKRNDHKNLAINHYSEADLAKYKITLGEA